MDLTVLIMEEYARSRHRLPAMRSSDLPVNPMPNSPSQSRLVLSMNQCTFRTPLAERTSS
jgi:hypothetical protein